MNFSLNTSSRVLLPILAELGTDVARRVSKDLLCGNLSGAVSISIDPRDYVTPGKYFRDAQAVALLKKCAVDIKGIDRRSAALKKWLDGEFQCYKSNERLSRLNSGLELDSTDLAVLRFSRKVAKKIRSWIGSSPPNLDQIRGKFGPGSTFSDRGRLTTVPDKISSKPTLTPGSFWYILPFLQTKWGMDVAKNHGEMSWVRGNRYLTVPKTALIDRSIAVEPAINVFYQLGLGSAIRQRLRNATGWCLDTAQERHRLRAKEASVSLKFATLDLSNASDTVSIELVRLLLPPRWFEELYALRSPFTLVDGKWRRLEKFSSMGNGYTFELETLLFSALLSVLLEETGHQGQLGEDLMVFGDDLIIPDEAAGSAVSMLAYFGFSTNPEKSFMGPVPFRESCGGDFFQGIDVRPYYIKELVNDPGELLPFINGVLRAYSKLKKFGPIKRDIESRLLSMVPLPLRRCRGPQEMGDLVIHSSDESRWDVRWRGGIRYFRSVVVVAKVLPWHHWRPDVVLACALYGTGDGLRGVMPRGAPLSYKVTWVPFS